MKTQTSIDWLAEQLRKYYNDEVNEIGEDHITDGMKHLLKHMDKKLKIARQMHREEVEYGYRVGLEDGVDNTNGETPLYRNASEYYSQIFQTSISI